MMLFPVLFQLGPLLAVIFLQHPPLANTAAIEMDRTTEQGDASIIDPDQECTPCNHAPVTNQLKSFPPVWEPASILPEDSAALAAWNSISATIPTSIAKKVPDVTAA
ncbi:hypothetical protein DFH05DRAFT_1584019 [Lentinula detonsa]|uniref:Secreted protein n=1 Tax=Lentinula detonsa TaxID=2804962 RepID=A0A9W8TT91_9AGAR|nr:hypothetical protein DFH05DRAFT_1584019 [Lentinula detonsa]KAJ3979930.1 hypothetical protein F5890DRAFT_1630606 [Lentinula detonsa]